MKDTDDFEIPIMILIIGLAAISAILWRIG